MLNITFALSARHIQDPCSQLPGWRGMCAGNFPGPPGTSSGEFGGGGALGLLWEVSGLIPPGTPGKLGAEGSYVRAGRKPADTCSRPAARTRAACRGSREWEKPAPAPWAPKGILGCGCVSWELLGRCPGPGLASGLSALEAEGHPSSLWLVASVPRAILKLLSETTRYSD